MPVMQPTMACPGRRFKANLRNGLAWWLPMNEGDGDKAFDRSVGGENTGTLINGPTRVATEIGPALDFEHDASQYVQLPVGGTPSAFSVSAWCVVETVEDNFPGIWFYGDRPLGAILDAGKSANKFLLEVWDQVGSAWRAAEANDVIVTGRLYHVCGTCDGITIRLYVDGVLQSTTDTLTGPINWLTPDRHEIGRYNDSQYWDGLIGNVARWNRALAPGEVWQVTFDPYEATNARLL